MAKLKGGQGSPVKGILIPGVPWQGFLAQIIRYPTSWARSVTKAGLWSSFIQYYYFQGNEIHWMSLKFAKDQESQWNSRTVHDLSNK